MVVLAINSMGWGRRKRNGEGEEGMGIERGERARQRLGDPGPDKVPGGAGCVSRPSVLLPQGTSLSLCHWQERWSPSMAAGDPLLT